MPHERAGRPFVCLFFGSDASFSAVLVCFAFYRLIDCYLGHE